MNTAQETVIGRARLVVLATGLTLMCAPGVFAQTIEIRPKWKQGQSVYLELKQKLDRDMGAMKIVSESTYGLIQNVLKSDSSGTTLELTIDRAKSFNDMMDSTFDTDDAKNPEAAAQMRVTLMALVGKRLRIEIAPDGSVKSVSGADEIKKALDPEVKANNMFAMMLAQSEFSEQRLRNAWAEIPMTIFPGKPVSVGDSWEKQVTDEIPRVGRTITTFRYKLNHIDEAGGHKVAHIDYEADVAPGDAEKNQPSGTKIGGKFTGKAQYDINDGMVVKRAQDGEMNIEMTSPMPMKIKVKSSGDLGVRSMKDREEEKALAIKTSKSRREAERLGKATKSVKPADAPTQANAPINWTQWGGPSRDFVSTATGLANSWPEGGPAKLWSRQLGDGYSGILVEGATVYTMYSIRDEKDNFKGSEVVVALDAGTGKTKWEYKYDAPWPKDKEMQMEFGPGPHSTPIIAGNRLITVGTTAKMFCLDKKTGKVLWSHDLQEEYKAELMNRGYGSSPLVYEENVILPIGGKGQALVAWHLSDGKEAWKGGDFDGTYSSLFPIKFSGEPQLLAFEAKEVCGLEPGSAKVKWSHPHKTQYGANISTPVYGDDGRIFISSAYGMGSRGVQLVSEGGKITSKELWYNPKMKIHHATAVRIGDVIYGSSGDFGPAFLAAVDLKTGEFLWKERGFSKANIIAADGKLIILDEDGNLAIGKATPQKFTLLSRCQPLKKTAWTVPTLSGTHLFIRDRKSIMALDLGASDKAS
jgi:outer membrane protein assembly factor BamB